MSGGAQFSSEVPKGDAWGVENAVHVAALEFEETGRSPMVPCIAVIGIKTVKLLPGDDGPTRVPVVQIKRIESLTTTEAIRAGQKLILQALKERSGSSTAPMLPFEEKQILDMAFGGLDIDLIEQDEREAKEDESMDDPQRLRRHLVAVHKHTADEIEGLEWTDVRTLHDSDHDRPESDGLLPHDREWWAWRRVDLEAAESEADGAGSLPDDNGPMNTEDRIVDALENPDDSDAGDVTPAFREPGEDSD